MFVCALWPYLAHSLNESFPWNQSPGILLSLVNLENMTVEFAFDLWWNLLWINVFLRLLLAVGNNMLSAVNNCLSWMTRAFWVRACGGTLRCRKWLSACERKDSCDTHLYCHPLLHFCFVSRCHSSWLGLLFSLRWHINRSRTETSWSKLNYTS